MITGSLGDVFLRWAGMQSEIHGVIQIGSRLRACDAPDAPDSYSDWDFQIITEQPNRFGDRRILDELGIGSPIAYVDRIGRLGSSRKVSALFSIGELDLVVLPLNHIIIAHAELRNERHGANALLHAGLMDLAAVISSGYYILKDSGGVAAEFLDLVRQKIPSPRFSDEQLHNIAEGFVCDYVSTHRKIDRGEFMAAQRWLHCYLLEANFRLLHELRQRRAQPSFPDARRLEVLLSGREYNQMVVSSAPTRECLQLAVAQAVASFRFLLAELLGNAWSWPESISHLRRE